MNNINIIKKRRHWIKLGLKALKLYINQNDYTQNMLKTSYNIIANSYNNYWTKKTHILSENMLLQLNPLKGGKSLDLTCGTGFVTNKLFEITGGNVTGVDFSEGMINVAKENYGQNCRFIQNDILDYLKKQPPSSYDVITCAWSLGYLPSYKVIKEISRILRSGGKVGIIDNSMFNNWEIVFYIIMALAEEPDALQYLIRSHYLLTTGSLTWRMRLNGIKVINSWKGLKIYKLSDRKKAMEQFIKSGAAAGIEQMINEKYKEKIINRVGELLQKYHETKDFVPIIHRYFAAVGVKGYIKHN